MKRDSGWLLSSLALTFVLAFQTAGAVVVGSDTGTVTATVANGLAGPEVDAYDTTPGDPLTVAFGTIDASTDYHLAPDANLSWAALGGSWTLLVYYDGASSQVQVTSGANTGSLLSVAIGWELDDAGAVANPPTDLTFDDVDGTYRVIQLGSVAKYELANATDYADIGVRAFVLAVSTKDGGAFDGDYAGTLTFDLDNGL